MRRLIAALLFLLPVLALAAGPMAPTGVAVAVSGTSATVTWTPPTKNTDGAPVTVSGYNIYLASTDAALTATANTAPKVSGSVLNSGAMSKYVMTGLAAGTYYLDMTSWAPVSPFSNHVSFTIAAPTALGTAVLSWTAPASNVDGSPIVNPLAYNIYKGTTATAVSSKLTLTPVSGLSYTAVGLIPGTWYFDVTAVDTVTKNESSASGVVSTTIAVATTPGPPNPSITCSVPVGSNLTCSLSPGR